MALGGPPLVERVLEEVSEEEMDIGLVVAVGEQGLEEGSSLPRLISPEMDDRSEVRRSPSSASSGPEGSGRASRSLVPR
jgi:hypothetical protein